jgi:hypothetical protein
VGTERRSMMIDSGCMGSLYAFAPELSFTCTQNSLALPLGEAIVSACKNSASSSGVVVRWWKATQAILAWFSLRRLLGVLPRSVIPTSAVFTRLHHLLRHWLLFFPSQLIDGGAFSLIDQFFVFATLRSNVKEPLPGTSSNDAHTVQCNPYTSCSFAAKNTLRCRDYPTKRRWYSPGTSTMSRATHYHRYDRPVSLQAKE